MLLLHSFSLHPSSLSCFCLSALFIISASLPFPFSLLLWTDFPMCCRCGYTPIQEGIAEKTSLVTIVSSGYAPYQFLQLALLKSWMKNDNTPALTQRKQVGESCSLAIRNLTKALGAGAGVHSVFLLLLSVIKSFNQASTLWRKRALRPKWPSCYELNGPGANIIRVYYAFIMGQASFASGSSSKLGMTLRLFSWSFLRNLAVSSHNMMIALCLESVLELCLLN